MDKQQFAGQFRTRHIGHGLVGDDEVETSRIRQERLEGLFPVPADRHVVAQTRQQHLGHRDYRFLVVDEEDGFVAAGGRGRHVIRPRIGSLLHAHGKEDVEPRAPPALAVDRDVPLV